MKNNIIKWFIKLIKQTFIALLSFSESLAKQSLNNQPCIARPKQLDGDDQASVSIYSQFRKMQSKFWYSFLYAYELICVPNKTKDINVIYLIWQKNERQKTLKTYFMWF